MKEKLRRIWAYISDASRIKAFAGYVLVAATASAVTVACLLPRVTRNPNLNSSNKLTVLQAMIDEYFIGDADMTKVEDAAAHAMIGALGDRWSFYIPASEMGAYQEQKDNAYVGIGVTIQQKEDGGLQVTQVTPGGSAEEAGVLTGDVITGVDGNSIAGMTLDAVGNLVRGEEGTQVKLTVLRSGTEQEITVTRKRIYTPVATGSLLEGNIGLIRIVNFNANCTKETVAAIESLRQQGATKLIFDVRFNPGGYAHEMVDLLDYLLPEGDLFRTVDYTGKEAVETSDAACLDMSMAVLVNGSSYSAAEFFAAALSEYDRAFVVGEQTSGKGHFQVTLSLPDGSAVALSIGKYYTPKGICLEGVGITPEVVLPVDEKTAAAIKAGTLDPAEDPQIQAAIQKLNEQ